MTDPPQDSIWDDYVPKPAEEVDPERVDVIARRFLASSDAGSLSPRRQVLKDAADATRLLIDRLMASGAPDEVLAEVTADIAAVAERLGAYEKASLYGFSETANVGAREQEALFDYSPLLGLANPLAPPMTITVAEGRTLSTVNFGLPYEGPPGCVHGGYLAAAFDELLGATQSLSGAPGMTGTLTVRYESPTPLQTDLRFEGRFLGVERRKILVEGTCHAGEVLTCRASGIFISLEPGTFLDLLAEREDRQKDLR